MRVSIYVPQCGTIEGITPGYRAFQTANEFLKVFGKKPIFEVEYVGLTEMVSANNGEYIIKTNRLLCDVSKTDLLIIPPTFGDITVGITANSQAIQYFTKLHSQGSDLASLCVGAYLLAETGLLKGKKCSTHWAYIEEFKERYPDIEVQDGAIITQSDNIYSSGGANSLWNLILYLIEKYSDREIAVSIAKYFALDIDRNSQSHFAIFKGQRNHDDACILLVQDYIEIHFIERITIDDLANHINVARRTFERRFKVATNNTPIEYIQRVRIEVAKKLFECSKKNVSEVMCEVGYSDTKAFRDVFRKITGLTPTEYRAKFEKLVAV